MVVEEILDVELVKNFLQPMHVETDLCSYFPINPENCDCRVVAPLNSKKI